MFEKEAEEYADNQIGCGDGYYEWTDVTQAYQKGAEFGYNKGNDEVITEAKEIIKNLLILKNDHYGNTKMEWRVEVTERAEQFLKENK